MASKSEILIAALQEAGYKPRSYSGRGMYGKECVAVSSDSLFAIGAVIVDIDAPEPESDKLGKRYIFYWPSYPWPEAGITERIDAKVEAGVSALTSAVDRAEAKTGHKLTITEAPTPQLVDVTPQALRTPEGAKRAEQAQKEWDDATHEIATYLKHSLDELFRTDTPKMTRAEIYSELQTLLGIRDVKQDAFIRAVTGR